MSHTTSALVPGSAQSESRDKPRPLMYGGPQRPPLLRQCRCRALGVRGGPGARGGPDIQAGAVRGQSTFNITDAEEYNGA